MFVKSHFSKPIYMYKKKLFIETIELAWNRHQFHLLNWNFHPEFIVFSLKFAISLFYKSEGGVSSKVLIVQMK